MRDKLEKANCFGLRSVLKLPHDCSYDDALHLGKLQSLERRRSCYSLSLVHQALTSARGPNYIKELFQIQQSRYNLRGGPLRLAQPTSNSKWTHRSFTYLVSRMWNNLPTELKHLELISSFKNAIKKANLTSGTLCKCNICEH